MKDQHHHRNLCGACASNGSRCADDEMAIVVLMMIWWLWCGYDMGIFVCEGVVIAVVVMR